MSKPGYTGLTRILKATQYSVQGLRAAWRHESAFRQECTITILLIPVAVICLVSGQAEAAVIRPPVETTRTPPSTTDLWDVSNGCQIVATYRWAADGDAGDQDRS